MVSGKEGIVVGGEIRADSKYRIVFSGEGLVVGVEWIVLG